MSAKKTGKEKERPQQRKILLSTETQFLAAFFLFEFCVFFSGLRKVYPYYFTFTTFTKGRWVGERILDVFAREFRAHPAEEYVSILTLLQRLCLPKDFFADLRNIP